MKIKVNKPLVIHCSAYALINESSLYHVVNFKVLGAHGFTDSLMMKESSEPSDLKKRQALSKQQRVYSYSKQLQNHEFNVFIY